ncbi:MAG: ABC transporter ATP-binding protein [Alphaproteobacteria bacterium]
MSHLKLKSLKKSYKALQVIHGVDLEIEEGEFLVFVGPSGCGKSTILRMIAGLETITSGELLINGQIVNDEAPVKRGVAMVFQSYALYPNMTVRQNLSFGLEQARLSKPEIKRLVDEAASTLKIEKLLDRRPGELSGGQSQRVAIGRAIVRHPDLFLFDEPLSNLDAELRVHMRVEIKALHERLKRTMIYVTHDQVEAMTMADRIVVFRDGKIEQVGTPLELYNAPVNKFVAAFIGSPQMNFLNATVSGDENYALPGGQLSRQSVATSAVGSDFTLGLRPEHIELGAPDQSLLKGRVLLVEQLGGESFLYLQLEDHPDQFVAKVPGQTAVKTGEIVGLNIEPKLMYQFDATTGTRLKSPQM